MDCIIQEPVSSNCPLPPQHAHKPIHSDLFIVCDETNNLYIKTLNFERVNTLLDTQLYTEACNLHEH